jgi:hypothetical protein
MSRPCGVVVSAHASRSELNPAPASLIAATVFSKSRVERASRSNRVTSKTSPGLRELIARRNWTRSVTAPLIFS